jgi:predicted amidohydrolase
MKISCAQFAPEYRDIQNNLDRIRGFVRASDVDIIIVPELAQTGYFFTSEEEIASLAQPIGGPIAHALSAFAIESNKAIITGFLEEDAGTFYNSGLAFDANGRLAGHYRKVHLFYYETQIFTTGDLGFPVFSLETQSGIAKVGMLICYDWRFPEAARKLALNGAELLAMPSNIVTTTGMLHATLRTRAFENKVAIAFADRIGSETNNGETLRFRGESCIIDMNGEMLATASEKNEEMITAEVDLAKTRNKRINPFNDIFTDRPETGYRL